MLADSAERRAIFSADERREFCTIREIVAERMGFEPTMGD
jgi:hypothetical protein